jgi:hypothetical protein
MAGWWKPPIKPRGQNWRKLVCTRLASACILSFPRRLRCTASSLFIHRVLFTLGWRGAGGCACIRLAASSWMGVAFRLLWSDRFKAQCIVPCVVGVDTSRSVVSRTDTWGLSRSRDGYFELDCTRRNFFLLKANLVYSGAWDSLGWDNRDAASSVGDQFSAGSEISG